MIWVEEAKPLPHRLWLRFSDGKQGHVELAAFIAADHRPIVRELRDEAKFADIKVDMDTVVWRNGFDLAPEFLYARVVKEAAA